MSQPETMTAAQFAALLKANGNDLRKIGKAPKNAAPTHRPLPPEPDLPPIRRPASSEATRLPPAPQTAVDGLACRARALPVAGNVGIAMVVAELGGFTPVSVEGTEWVMLTYWTRDQALAFAAQIVEACRQ